MENKNGSSMVCDLQLLENRPATYALSVSIPQVKSAPAFLTIMSKNT